MPTTSTDPNAPPDDLATQLAKKQQGATSLSNPSATTSYFASPPSDPNSPLGASPPPATTAFSGGLGATPPPATSSFGQGLLGGSSPTTTSFGQGQLGASPAPTPSVFGSIPASQYNPPQSATAAQPAPQSGQVAQGSSSLTDPFAASGGGQYINGGWIPNNNPGAIAAAQGTAQAASPLTAAPAPASTSFTNASASTPSSYYTPGTIGPSTVTPYSGVNASAYAAPDLSGMQNGQNSILSQILANPLTMSDQNVSALKETQKESALAMQKQLSDQYAQSAAGRNVMQGGDLGAEQRRLGDSTQSAILGSNRAIDLQKMQQDRTDQLNAMNAAEAAMTGQSNRANMNYQDTLAGQAAQRQNNQFGFTAGVTADQSALARAMAGQSLQQAGATSSLANLQSNRDLANAQAQQQQAIQSLAVQKLLGQGALTNDQARIAESGRQYDLSQSLAMQQFLESQRQFNDTLGFNYTGLQNTGNNAAVAATKPPA